MRRAAQSSSPCLVLNAILADLHSSLSFLAQRRPALIGMVHVQALPGTPRHTKTIDQIINTAVQEATCLAEAGFDALMIENMHDLPYLLGQVGPEIVAGMTAVGQAIRSRIDLPLGVQVLAAANSASLAVAHTIGASFIRCEGFVFASVADEGIIEQAAAGPLLRTRKSLDAENVAILADIKKKHSAHALTSDISLTEMAHAAAFNGADGVIVTGTVTSIPPDPHEAAAAAKCERPVLIGSGLTTDNIESFAQVSDGLIIGSALKQDGHWDEALDPARVTAIAQAVQGCRTTK